MDVLNRKLDNLFTATRYRDSLVARLQDHLIIPCLDPPHHLGPLARKLNQVKIKQEDCGVDPLRNANREVRNDAGVLHFHLADDLKEIGLGWHEIVPGVPVASIAASDKGGLTYLGVFRHSLPSHSEK
jgi:hypothetical protein